MQNLYYSLEVQHAVPTRGSGSFASSAPTVSRLALFYQEIHLIADSFDKEILPGLSGSSTYPPPDGRNRLTVTWY